MMKTSFQLRALMLKEHGCTVPWLPDPIFCTAENMRGTAEDLLSTYKVLMKTGKITDLCPMPCGNMKFVIGWPDIGKDQVGKPAYILQPKDKMSS